MTTGKYIVIEQAGYVGERDVKEFDSYVNAHAWMTEHYDENEEEDLHVDIAFEDADGNRTFECY